MARLGLLLAQAVPQLRGEYQYTVLDSDQLDALSLPGGRIYVTRALYDRLGRDDLVAAMLAHEMAHLAAKDHFKPRPRNPDQALGKELSADAFAADLLEAAGLGRAALLDLITVIEDTLPDGWVQARTANISRTPHDPHNDTIHATARCRPFPTPEDR